MRALMIGLLGFLSALIIRPAEASYDIRIVAQTYEPLQMLQDAEPKGYVVELVREVIDRVRKTHPLTISRFDILPWARAFHFASTKPNTLFFSLSRTPKREDLFHWIGEVANYDVHFFKLRKRTEISGTSLEGMRRAGRVVGVPNKGNTYEFVKALGFKNGTDYIAYSHYSKGLRMLFNGRFDAMPLSSFNARILACREGFDGDNLVSLFKIEPLSKPLWMILSKGSPPELVAAFRAALKSVHADGFAEPLRDKTLAAFGNQPCAVMSK